MEEIPVAQESASEASGDLDMKKSQSHRPTPWMARRVSPWLFLCVLVLGIGVFVFLKQTYLQKNIDTATEISPYPATAAKPTPSYLPPGKQSYVVSQSSANADPIITGLTVDPLNVRKGNRQIVEVTMTSKTPVQSVSVTLFTDNTKQTLALTSASSSASASTWKGSWTIEDSVSYRYVYTITANSQTGESISYVAVRTVGPIKINELK